MKAIVAINDETGEIRSGQSDGMEGFGYYILKFGDKSMPIAEIEAAYYNMAIAAGIDMEECRLLSVEGTNHFLTKRFDRRDGKKIFVQTLAAINPEASSYEDLIDTCRELNISESEIEQIFIRMVFNVMANNTDDHNKNFSFLIDEFGNWRIAPAYDMTFIFNMDGTGPNLRRRLSIGGKTSDISKSDIIGFAQNNGIADAEAIITRVAKAVMNFNEYAETNGVTQPWRGIIRKTLTDNLVSYGSIDKESCEERQFKDKHGRLIDEVSVSVNSKGLYEVIALIDGNRHRRFVKPGMDLYSELNEKDIYNLSDDDLLRLTNVLFPMK